MQENNDNVVQLIDSANDERKADILEDEEEPIDLEMLQALACIPCPLGEDSYAKNGYYLASCTVKIVDDRLYVLAPLRFNIHGKLACNPFPEKWGCRMQDYAGDLED